MANPIMDGSTVYISIPPHASSISGSSTIITLNSSTHPTLNSTNILVDGDQGKGICPICGAVITATINGNCNITIDGKSICVTGASVDINHVGYPSLNPKYDTTVNIS